jgi:hypothetical protein
MTYLYDRRWQLQVGTFVTDELRVTFDITRSLDWHSNQATISVYNLARSTRDQFNRGQSVSLIAGYRDNSDLIFSGVVTFCQTLRSGPDWITTLECGDGAAAFGQYVRQSYSAGAPLTVVVGAIATAMGLVLAPEATALLSGKVTRGKLVQSGLAPIALQTLLSSYGLQWSIQSGILQVLPTDGSTAETVVLLSPQTGLIGTPERNETDRRNRQTVTAKSLLQGAIKPGRRVVLQSATINGTFTADDVQHRGDSRADTWETEVTMLAQAVPQ